MSKIVQVEWRSAIDTVGIVLVKRDGDGKFRAYIGQARGFDNSAYEDAQYIAAHGAKLTFNEAKGFFPTHLSNRDEYAV